MTITRSPRGSQAQDNMPKTVCDPTTSASTTPDWVEFAQTLLAALHGTSWAGWTSYHPRDTTEVPNADSPRDGEWEEDTAASSGEATNGRTNPGRAAVLEDADDSVDAVLDKIERESEMGETLPPCPDPAHEKTAIWNPRPVTLLAVLRLARTFGRADMMLEALGRRGALTLLGTGSPALDQTVFRVLESVVIDDTIWPETALVPVTLLADDALRSGTIDRHRLLANLCSKVRDAVERGTPLVMVAPVAGTAPEEVRDLRPREIQMVSLDRPMLSMLLELAYPDQGAPAALAALPEGCRLSRLGPDALTLALRDPDPDGAVRSMLKILEPVGDTGRGLADYPLPASVRAPVEQLVTDLRDWQEGSLPWRDVSRGPIVVGPPGSGKTELARLVARDAGVAVIAGSLAQWSSESARGTDVIKAMRAAFASAAEQAPALLFIDELDSFGDRARPQDHNSTYTDFIVAGLLDLLDGFHAHEGVVVMAATNHIQKLDRALIRPGRFDHIVTLDHPSHENMPKVIRWHLGGDLPDADLSSVAAQAVGASGADIAAAVRAARARARARARKTRRALTLVDLQVAVDEACPPLPDALRRRIAVHEAGHALVGLVTGVARPSLLAIRSDGGTTHTTLAGDTREEAQFAGHLAVDLAGRAAERLVLGKASAGAGGACDSDLAKATRTAAALETSFGLGESLLWLGTPEAAIARLNLDPGLRVRVETRLQEAEARALNILQSNRVLLDDMTDALFAAGVLTGAALEDLLARVVTNDGPDPGQVMTPTFEMGEAPSIGADTTDQPKPVDPEASDVPPGQNLARD